MDCKLKGVYKSQQSRVNIHQPHHVQGKSQRKGKRKQDPRRGPAGPGGRREGVRGHGPWRGTAAPLRVDGSPRWPRRDLRALGFVVCGF